MRSTQVWQNGTNLQNDYAVPVIVSWQDGGSGGSDVELAASGGTTPVTGDVTQLSIAPKIGQAYTADVVTPHGDMPNADREVTLGTDPTANHLIEFEANDRQGTYRMGRFGLTKAISDTRPALWVDAAGDHVWTPGTDRWVNAPTGTLTLQTNRPIDVLDERGWADVEGGAQRLTIEVDAASPLSPSNIFQFQYPNGESGTVFGGQAKYSLPAGTKEIYFGFLLKVVTPWQDHSAQANPKLVFLLDDATGGAGDPGIVNRANVAGGLELLAAVQNADLPPTKEFPQNLNGSTPLNEDTWYEIEIHAVMNSEQTTDVNGDGTSDGEYHCWVNGVKVIEYLNVWFSDALDPDFEHLDFQPLWGGTGDTLTQDNFLHVGHLIVATV